MMLDEIHLSMLNLLRGDARISMTALAERLGISRANAYSRLDALTQAGIIEGFTAIINPTAVGKPISAVIFVSVRQSMWEDFRRHLTSVAELAYFALTTGEFDAILLVRAESVSSVHRLILEHISTWDEVRSTRTAFVMEEAVFQFELAPKQGRLEAVEDGPPRLIVARHADQS